MKTLNKFNFAKCLSLLFILVLALPPSSSASRRLLSLPIANTATHLNHSFTPLANKDPLQFVRAFSATATPPEYEVPKAVDGRVDMTDTPFITIDPKQAHELDDAAYVEALGEGKLRCQVAIADPVCLMKDPSVLKKAIGQVFTLYEKDPVVPLFPNGLTSVASLTPNKTCPSVVVDFVIQENGELAEEPRIYQALMRSVAKLNYTQVNRYKAGERTINPLHQPLIDSIYNAALALKSKREGQDLTFISSEQAVAEMMITANMIVARHIKSIGLSAPFRTQLKPGERAFYSHKPQRHASLSNMLYTHFTSPLRRLPDCLVHAALFYPAAWAQIGQLYGIIGDTDATLTKVLAQVNEVDNRLKDEARDKKRKTSKKRRVKKTSESTEAYSEEDRYNMTQYHFQSAVNLNEDSLEALSGDTFSSGNSSFEDDDSMGLMSLETPDLSDAEEELPSEEERLLRRQKKAEKKRNRKARSRSSTNSSELHDQTPTVRKPNTKQAKIRADLEVLKEQLRLLEEKLEEAEKEDPADQITARHDHNTYSVLTKKG